MSIEWSKLLQLEDGWLNKHLISQTFSKDVKIVVRGYSIKFSGTTNNYKALAQELSNVIANFTHSKAEVKKKGLLRADKDAQKIFGQINPSKDGKYGELLLFALVETILKCPMVAHKIPTSFNDQVKGGDGIFIGNYEVAPGKMHEAILIGESKIWQDYSSALEDSLSSINRFHDSITKGQFNSQELIVAKKGLFVDDSIDVDVLYKYLSPGEDEFQNCVQVHPTFIMYQTNEISNIEQKALTPIEAETLIAGYLDKRHKQHVGLINEKMQSYTELKKVFLDFFILPVKNVDEFRNELFYEIHGLTFKP